MTTRENFANQGCVKALIAATKTADENGPGIDLRGFDSAVITANIGASGDTLSSSVKIELEVEESDDNTTYTDVANADLLKYVTGTNVGTFAVVDDAAEDDAVYITAYRGSKRYVRVGVNLTGEHTNGTPISAVAVLGHSHVTPVNRPTD